MPKPPRQQPDFSLIVFTTNEAQATVCLGRRVAKASSSMLPRSVPPLGQNHYICAGDDGDGSFRVKKKLKKTDPLRICFFAWNLIT